ncbi:hypothetical protein LCV63_002413 [Salmonella enterica]|nr:hypothetical protein [Salmonella enterica]EDQ3387243.1 hypothetical protein [Salmonella enterica subsp. houtenae]EHY68062.1 hypothetical protein SEHO0A_03815 [Salmonella enterica subsp. houtenae str. ATCC BAA-1581]EDQ1100163.1 hypothetical protein [Salmonella enterica]EDR1134912.1 hypothetical protein [Salmonella enterica]EDR6714942.1 hypothetical protein [Salmonella enterica subsp. houtenae]
MISHIRKVITVTDRKEIILLSGYEWNIVGIPALIALNTAVVAAMINGLFD